MGGTHVQLTRFRGTSRATGHLPQKSLDAISASFSPKAAFGVASGAEGPPVGPAPSTPARARASNPSWLCPGAGACPAAPVPHPHPPAPCSRTPNPAPACSSGRKPVCRMDLVVSLSLQRLLHPPCFSQVPKERSCTCRGVTRKCVHLTSS